MRFFLLFTTLLLLSPRLVLSVEPPTLLVIGDSISSGYGINTQSGWVNLLQSRLHENGYPHRVINASVAGETTLNGVTRLPALLLQYDPAIVIIELGGNDGLRGLPLTQMQKNLEQLIHVSLNHGSQVMLTGIRLPPNYGPDYNRRFASVFSTLANHYALTFQPRLLQGIADRPELMQSDGIHPLGIAQAAILNNVWPQLETLIRPEIPIPGVE
jgi:acyl-CoA thioesterase-1